ncbi:hypothetical protein PRZ48_010610 [Zasmidium cellare]|uniref:Enoyl reductase (ER) domain-containing protein n=1 Tax=Zasmidium cellare TaxID=395010 RepID=A0ABR0E9G4_ZASCE|nr:hypothetical protein PRZ48_010610 [Zasmidium cellare]
MVKTRQWVIAKRAVGMPVLEGPNATFRLVTKEIGSPEDGQLLVKTMYFSNDPSTRGWIGAGKEAERLYVPRLAEGSPIPCHSLARVVESRVDEFAEGELVCAWTGWSEYAIVPKERCTKAPPLPGGLSQTHYLGALGYPALTAYVGLYQIARATAEDIIVVSAAAGATGSMAVQLAKKVVGCQRVIGIAGTEAKCRWVEGLGADICLNYNSPTFADDLVAATPDFVNVYYDNVGGEILDLMLPRMARYGRVVACGAIANYNKMGEAKVGMKNYFEIVNMRVRLEGFTVRDYAPQFEDILRTLKEELARGNLKIDEELEQVVPATFEEVPKTWMVLFSGGNQGKLITELRDG